MKPENLNHAKLLCKKLDQLKHHAANFHALMTDDLSQSQFDLQQSYALNLQKEIRKTEKEIAEL